MKISFTVPWKISHPHTAHHPLQEFRIDAQGSHLRWASSQDIWRTLRKNSASKPLLAASLQNLQNYIRRIWYVCVYIYIYIYLFIYVYKIIYYCVVYIYMTSKFKRLKSPKPKWPKNCLNTWVSSKNTLKWPLRTHPNDNQLYKSSLQVNIKLVGCGIPKKNWKTTSHPTCVSAISGSTPQCWIRQWSGGRHHSGPTFVG